MMKKNGSLLLALIQPFPDLNSTQYWRNISIGFSVSITETRISVTYSSPFPGFIDQFQMVSF
jgi:hypothetical protein